MSLLFRPPFLPPRLGSLVPPRASAYIEFFLNSASSVVQLETLQISHPSFSKVYYIVRNAMNGITATLEDSTVASFEYYPLGISQSGASDDLDQVMNITLGDLGQMVPQEIDRAAAAGTMNTRPLVIYRTYRSDDLSAPIDGPLSYEVTTIGLTKKNSMITAGAPRVNLNMTGETYSMTRFPMMRGFL